MSTDRDLVVEFGALLAGTLERLDSLDAALQAERQALGGRDPDALQRCVRDKLEALAALEHAVLARDRVQSAAGLPPGLDGGRQFVASLAPDQATAWQALLGRCRDIERSNHANGQLVARNTRQARDALSLLTGREQAPQLYGRQHDRTAFGSIARQSFGRV